MRMHVGLRKVATMGFGVLGCWLASAGIGMGQAPASPGAAAPAAVATPGSTTPDSSTPDSSSPVSTPAVAPAAGPAHAPTSLDRYVQQPDDAYRWKIVSAKEEPGLRTLVVDMTSQSWRGPHEVNRTQWQHWMTFAIPTQAAAAARPMAFLFISGGSNGGEPPAGPSEEVRQLALGSGGIVVELKMVPNQALIFHNDGQKRVEDDLVGYTWDQFLKTEDPTWLARHPMVKSAVRAMDTITAVMATAEGGRQTVNEFVVGGGSKRGWTTWLTGAVDQRVKAIVPIVIDVLNVRPSMEHHFAAYGYWAPSINDYIQHNIMQRLDDPRLEKLYQNEDPFHYRHRLTMPKFVVNAAGDQFFLPDSSQFYWHELPSEKFLRYVPNADHGLDGSDALSSIAAFYQLMLLQKTPPTLHWEHAEDGSLKVRTGEAVQEVRLWKATNSQTRDFRVETFGRKFDSTLLSAVGSGEYLAQVAQPEQGWTAYFVEVTYDVGGALPIKLTTDVRVIPDVLPYKDKPMDLPASITVAAEAPDEATAERLVQQAGPAMALHGVGQGPPLTERNGKVFYVNWQPKASFEEDAKLVIGYLKQQDCREIRVQLESGRGITKP